MPEEQKRQLLEFCKNPANAKVVEYIKRGSYNTSTGEFILTSENGSKVIFKMDDLINGNVDFSPLFIVQKEEEIEEILEEPKLNSADEMEEILDENLIPKSSTITLYDLNNAVQEKDVNKVDEMLASFSINPNTGLVDIDRAIGIATIGTLNEAVKCIQNNTNFSADLSHYDLKGNAIKAQDEQAEAVDIAKICDKSFENILVYVETAKLKGIVYDEEKQLKAKRTYATMLNDKLNVLGLNKQNNDVAQNKGKVNDDVVELSSKSSGLTLKPTKDLKKAGFADIFILTIIVIVYAVIIINLILKLK